MGVESTVQSVCDLALQFGESGMARPFGVALLMAGVDENGPQLYETDPSGTYTKYLARAIGAGAEGAASALQEHYNKSMSLEEAKKLAMQILKQVMEDKLTSTNVELALITSEEKEFRVLTPEELEPIISTLEDSTI